MSEAKSILNKRMLLIDINKSQNHLPLIPYTYAYYLPRTGKVWISKTRHIQRVIDNLRHIRTRLSVIKTFPEAVKSRFEDSGETEVVLYISHPSVLINTPLIMELENIGALLKTATKENKVSKVVWVITHRESGHYKFIRTSKINQTPCSIFETFMYSLRRSPKDSKCSQFLSTYQSKVTSMADFNVEVLIKAENDRQVNIAINRYVRAKGGSLSLSINGVSKQALKTH